MADWDPDHVTIGKGMSSKDSRSKEAINSALRKGGSIETTEKYGAITNKQSLPLKNTVKLDRETEELKHDKVSFEFSKLLQQARMDKGMTQKELATKANEKPQVVNDYEAGRAVPNQAIIGKLERALGVKLRGVDAGEPLHSGKKKSVS